MGTRSQTVVYDAGEKIVQIYRQMDGYPSGHGKALVEFMTGLTLVNGIRIGTQDGTQVGRIANGAGCFAAQLVGHLKQGWVGSIYLEPTSTGIKQHDFTYELRIDPFVLQYGVFITVYNWKEKVFKGTLEQFTEFCNR